MFSWDPTQQFGFILENGEGGDKVFCHQSAVKPNRRLKPGESVSYQVEEFSKKLRAKNVVADSDLPPFNAAVPPHATTASVAAAVAAAVAVATSSGRSRIAALNSQSGTASPSASVTRLGSPSALGPAWSVGTMWVANVSVANVTPPAASVAKESVGAEGVGANP